MRFDEVVQHVDLQLFAAGEGQQTTQQQQVPATQDKQQDKPGKVYTEEDISKIVSSRVNELNRKYSPYQKVVERLTQVTGLDLAALDAELEKVMSEITSRSPVNQVPVSTQVPYTPYSNYPGGVSVPNDAALRAAQKAQELALETQLDLQERELKAKPEYAELGSDPELAKSVREYAKKYNVSLEAAFWALQGPQKAAKLKQEAEQRVLAEMKEKLSRGGVISDMTSTPSSTPKLDPDQQAYARFFGMDEEEYAALAQERVGDRSFNLDDFDALMAKKRGKTNG